MNKLHWTMVCRQYAGRFLIRAWGSRACFLEALASCVDRRNSLAVTDIQCPEMTSVKRRGVGIASGWYGCGNTSLPNPSTIKCGIRADGTDGACIKARWTLVKGPIPSSRRSSPRRLAFNGVRRSLVIGAGY